jgi:hypothetical protein
VTSRECFADLPVEQVLAHQGRVSRLGIAKAAGAACSWMMTAPRGTVMVTLPGSDSRLLPISMKFCDLPPGWPPRAP